MVIANARKSNFWSTDNSMHVMDQSKHDFKGEIVQKGSDITVDSGITYLEGNARIIEELIATLKPDQQNNCLYFGD